MTSKVGADAVTAFKVYMADLGPDRLPREFWFYVGDLVVINSELTTSLFVGMLKGEMTPADVLYRLCMWFAEAFKDGSKEASQEDKVKYIMAAARVTDFLRTMNKSA